jgi:hypothetical protein
MPTYATDGKYCFISYVTGPSHVRLGLAFHAEPVVDVKIVAQPSVGSCNHGELDEEEIRKAVFAGAEEACGQERKTLYLSGIVYVKNDSPRYSLYRHCAKLLIERMIAGGEFKKIEKQIDQ